MSVLAFHLVFTLDRVTNSKTNKAPHKGAPVLLSTGGAYREKSPVSLICCTAQSSSSWQGWPVVRWSQALASSSEMADGPTWGHPESGKVSTEIEQETWGAVSVALWLLGVQARATLTIEREKIRAAIRLAKMCLVFVVLVMYLVSHVEPIMSRDLYLDSKEGGLCRMH